MLISDLASTAPPMMPSRNHQPVLAPVLILARPTCTASATAMVSSTDQAVGSTRAAWLSARWPSVVGALPCAWPTRTRTGAMARASLASTICPPMCTYMLLVVGMCTNVIYSVVSHRREEIRRQPIESEQHRRDDLREGLACLKDVLPVSNQKGSKMALLGRGKSPIPSVFLPRSLPAHPLSGCRLLASPSNLESRVFRRFGPACPVYIAQYQD